MKDLILNNGQTAKYIGQDDWSRPLYKLENGITVCCTEFDGSSLHTIYGDFCEPCSPLKYEYQAVINSTVKEKDWSHEYMMLSRYQSDVEYFLGNGDRNEKHLYYGSCKEHISKMIELWRSLPKKPKWLTAVNLINYKSQLI